MTREDITSSVFPEDFPSANLPEQGLETVVKNIVMSKIENTAVLNLVFDKIERLITSQGLNADLAKKIIESPEIKDILLKRMIKEVKENGEGGLDIYIGEEAGYFNIPNEIIVKVKNKDKNIIWL